MKNIEKKTVLCTCMYVCRCGQILRISNLIFRAVNLQRKGNYTEDVWTTKRDFSKNICYYFYKKHSKIMQKSTKYFEVPIYTWDG